ncbi:hypothetical protein UE94_025655, partial [Burkholderia cenocepacia]|uniref:hypothetical protein n=1 Tax=Burkholderia cenocepacia TaxID=95486 RepID=UPI00222A39DE
TGQARLSSWRGEQSPQRRRIDLGKPHTASKIGVAKKGVTIDFLCALFPAPGPLRRPPARARLMKSTRTY